MENVEIEQKVLAALPLDEVYVMSEDGSHFQLIAVGEFFAPLSRVARQQAIYKVLAEEIASNQIHALSIKTYTPEIWKRERQLLGL